MGGNVRQITEDLVRVRGLQMNRSVSAYFISSTTLVRVHSPSFSMVIDGGSRESTIPF